LFCSLLLTTVSWAGTSVASVNPDGSLSFTTPDIQDGTANQHTISGYIASIIAIVTGLIFCYFGHRFFKVTLFITGFYIFALCGWLLLINIEPQTGYGGSTEWIFLGVCLVVGLIGGGLFLCVWKLGIACIGAIGGFFLGLLILSFNENGFVTNHVARGVVILVAVIVGIILSFFFDRLIVIFGTSIAGSYVTTLGIDNITHTNFSAAAMKFLDGNHNIVYQINAAVIGMMILFLFLFITGVIFQHRKHKSPFHPNRRHYERTGSEKA